MHHILPLQISKNIKMKNSQLAILIPNKTGIIEYMSYHILHLTTPNIKLYCEKGFLFCKYDDESEKKLPIADIRAIIVATHQVSFTNSCLARLMENDIVILHCNNHFKPIGWSLGLDRVVRTKAFLNQIEQNEIFDNTLWKTILFQKMQNKANCLNLIGVKEHSLEKLINRPLVSEGNVAKQFIKAVKQIAPSTGSINVIYITDAQWSNSVCIQKSDYNRSKYKTEIGEITEKQMTFW